MRPLHRVIYSFLSLIALMIISLSLMSNQAGRAKIVFPYKKAGLTEREAAAHLLSRFTYGARPDDIDKVLKVGLEKWFFDQLDGKLPDPYLDEMLSQYPDIHLSNSDVENIYPRQASLLKMAIKDGAIDKDSVNKGDRTIFRQQINAYMAAKGLKTQQELYRQFINQKILRAANSENQMREVLTDLWFNHFNVSITKPQCAAFIPAYERDVIRPNVTGKFENLLLATAKSPAMLIYLDNFNSTGESSVYAGGASKSAQKRVPKKKGGLNENYAREVMELHTLGVDGGYTQNDVTQAARVLTGWTIAPMGEDGYGSGMKKVLENTSSDSLDKQGFVRDGDFLFVPSRHDSGEKTILGKKFVSNGYQEGVTLLKMLANHPSTALFISRKIAVRFVSDQPSDQLLRKMVKTFKASEGNIKEVIISMVSAPEFWQKEALREKTKSPFELAISAVRGLNATITQPYQLFGWVNKMGQKIYYYQAPTGFPDRSQYWINTGSLLNRMNFGLALANGKIPGVKVDLLALNSNHEPESAEAALIAYSRLVLPERDLRKTIERLSPMLKDPDLSEKIARAAEKTPATGVGGEPKTSKNSGNNSMLAQVVGVIIGSPEFQRK